MPMIQTTRYRALFTYQMPHVPAPDPLAITDDDDYLVHRKGRGDLALSCVHVDAAVARYQAELVRLYVELDGCAPEDAAWIEHRIRTLEDIIETAADQRRRIEDAKRATELRIHRYEHERRQAHARQQASSVRARIVRRVRVRPARHVRSSRRVVRVATKTAVKATSGPDPDGEPPSNRFGSDGGSHDPPLDSNRAIGGAA